MFVIPAVTAKLRFSVASAGASVAIRIDAARLKTRDK